MTPRQFVYMEMIKTLPEKFSSRDFAPLCDSVNFFRGIGYRCKHDVNIWSNEREDLEAMGYRDIERYDYTRRAVLTASSRLSQLERSGLVKSFDEDGKKLWSLA